MHTQGWGAWGRVRFSDIFIHKTYATCTHRVGGLGSLIFSYIGRLGSFLGFKILNFNIFFLVFRRINIFGDMKTLWIFLGGPYKI